MSYCYTVLHGGFRGHSGGTQQIPGLEARDGRKVRRCWAACEAVAIGWGGITVVSEATGISRPTIRAGIAEMRSSAPAAEEVLQRRSIRRVGGGQQFRTLIKNNIIQLVKA